MSSFKERLRAGEFLLGTFVKTPAVSIVEVLADCGLDCICLDAEHAPFDRAAVDLGVLVARAHVLPVLVRVASDYAHHLLSALDCGADGLLVPHVRNAAEAEAIARACHFGRGGRGYAGSTRAARYGRVTMPEHLAASGARTVVIAQIEDVEAISEAEAIARVPDIDALFIGRIDLTVSLGASSPDDPDVIAAVETVLAAARAAGKPAGMFVPDSSDVPYWRGKGATLFLQSSDHGLMRAGAEALRRQVRGG